MTKREPQDDPGSLIQIARLINAGRIAEADALLKPTEADTSLPEWKRPLTISVLRDRIKEATP